MSKKRSVVNIILGDFLMFWRNDTQSYLKHKPLSQSYLLNILLNTDYTYYNAMT